MEIPAKLKLVEPRLIPKGEDCSGEDLVNLFKLGLLLQDLCEKGALKSSPGGRKYVLTIAGEAARLNVPMPDLW